MSQNLIEQDNNIYHLLIVEIALLEYHVIDTL